MKQVFIASRCSTRVSVVSAIEVLRIWFLLDPAPELEPLPKELELELLGSGSLLESDPPMELALFFSLLISNINSGGPISVILCKVS